MLGVMVAGHDRLAMPRWLAFGVLMPLICENAALAHMPLVAALDDDRQRPSERRIAPPTLRDEKPRPRFELPPVVPPREEAPLSDAPTFVLRAVRFVGNTVFTADELALVVEPYIGRRVSTEGIEEIRRRVSTHYLNAGYINSGAVIPDQRVNGDVVVMRIIEGTLSEIEVEGNLQTHPDYIRDRLMLGAGPPLNVRELQERVQILLQDPLVERIDVRLIPGTRLGEAGLQVAIKEAKRYDTRLSFSNARPPSVGSFERRVDVELHNLSGWGDSYRVAYARTDGLEEVSFRMAIPVTPSDTEIFFGFYHTDAEVVEEPFSIIDVESKSRTYEFGFIHPVYRSVNSRLRLGMEFARRESTTFLLGFPFSSSAGSDNGFSRVNVFRFVQDWLDRTRDQVVAARSSFNLGLDIFGATANSSPVPDGEYLSWLGQVQWVRRVFGDRQMILRADAQFSRDRLLSLEKYSTGGVGSVRGYRENQLVKDQGYTLSLEGRIPILKIPIPKVSVEPQDGTLEFTPFFDFGRAWDKDVPNTGETKIFSVGVGLRWRIRRDINATIYYAIPLREVPDTAEHSLQDNGIHFRVTASVF